jgi:hypothetical protein
MNIRPLLLGLLLLLSACAGSGEKAIIYRCKPCNRQFLASAFL